MLRSVGLFIVSVALGVAVIACSEDENGIDEAPQPTAVVDIDAVACEGAQNGDATANCTLREAIEMVNAAEVDIINFHPPVAVITAEAERFCPEGVDACVSAYVSQAASTGRAVLCVNESNGIWYLATLDATPDAALGQEENEASTIGENCREPGHVAVAVVGGGN